MTVTGPNWFYPLHRAELAVLARVVTEAGPRAVVCGDFNVSRESSLFGDFMAATGPADAFGGACPPTFRAEYLPAGLPGNRFPDGGDNYALQLCARLLDLAGDAMSAAGLSDRARLLE